MKIYNIYEYRKKPFYDFVYNHIRDLKYLKYKHTVKNLIQFTSLYDTIKHSKYDTFFYGSKTNFKIFMFDMNELYDPNTEFIVNIESDNVYKFDFEFIINTLDRLLINHNNKFIKIPEPTIADSCKWFKNFLQLKQITNV